MQDVFSTLQHLVEQALFMQQQIAFADR